jgi:hypothetical protein
MKLNIGTEEVKREFEATTEATTAPEYRAIMSRFLALKPPEKTEANPDEVACLDRAPFAWTKSKQTAVFKERKQKETEEKDAGSDNAKVVVLIYPFRFGQCGWTTSLNWATQRRP